MRQLIEFVPWHINYGTFYNAHWVWGENLATRPYVCWPTGVMMNLQHLLHDLVPTSFCICGHWWASNAVFLFEWLCMGKRIVQLKIKTNLWSARASDFQNAGFLLGNFLKYSHPKSNNTVCMYSYKCDLHYIYDLGWDMLTKGLSAQPFLFPSFFSWNLPFIIAFFTIAFFYASLVVESSGTPLTTILDYTR